MVGVMVIAGVAVTAAMTVSVGVTAWVIVGDTTIVVADAGDATAPVGVAVGDNVPLTALVPAIDAVADGTVTLVGMLVEVGVLVGVTVGVGVLVLVGVTVGMVVTVGMDTTVAVGETVGVVMIVFVGVAVSVSVGTVGAGDGSATGVSAATSSNVTAFPWRTPRTLLGAAPPTETRPRLRPTPFSFESDASVPSALSAAIATVKGRCVVLAACCPPAPFVSDDCNRTSPVVHPLWSGRPTGAL